MHYLNQKEDLMETAILIIDDHISITQCLKCYFQIKNPAWNIMVANNCTEARDIFRMQLLDAAVIDFNLPDGNGLDLLRELRVLNSKLPIIMITGSDPAEVDKFAPKDQCYYLIRKPFDLQKVLDCVEMAIFSTYQKSLDYLTENRPVETQFEEKRKAF